MKKLILAISLLSFYFASVPSFGLQPLSMEWSSGGFPVHVYETPNAASTHAVNLNFKGQTYSGTLKVTLNQNGFLSFEIGYAGLLCTGTANQEGGIYNGLLYCKGKTYPVRIW